MPIEQYAAYVREMRDKVFGVRPSVVSRPRTLAAERPAVQSGPATGATTRVRSALAKSISDQAARNEAALLGQVVRGRDVLRQVSAEFDVSVVDIISHRRTHSITLVRQWAMYRCRTETTLSLPQIGDLFGGRDHTTVLHAVRKIEAMLARASA